MPWRRCRGRRLWRERPAPPYEFADEFYWADPWPADTTSATLVRWWRPESLVSLSDGASLSAWADSSGNGATATPYTAVKPVYHREVQNGLGAVLFAGTTDVLGFAQTGAIGDWTVVIVAGGLDVATNAVHYAVALTGAGVALGGTDATFGFLGEYQDGTKNRFSTIKPTAWGVDILTPAHIYRDNVEVAYGTVTGTMDRLNFTDLGGRNDAANLGVVGYLGEVLIYDGTLSDSDRADVSLYLRHRWSTP